MNGDRFRRIAFLIILAVITAFFLAMIRRFLVVILLAAVFAGLASPLYGRFLRAFHGRRTAAGAFTLFLLLTIVVVPLLAILGLVAKQAYSISQIVGPWIQVQLRQPDLLLEKIPGIERLAPYHAPILGKGAEMVGSLGTFLFNSLSATTKGTVAFLFKFFLFLYTMFFFLVDGGPILKKVLHYLPLAEKDERRMVDKFTSVTRATLKGTLVVGLLQGTLAGIAFWIVGIQGALFWGTVMTFLSIIPGIGTALVWAPAMVILFARGIVGSGVFLGLFCLLVVGMVDNLLRPRLVGRDTQMHDLLILFGTLGGLLLFGVLGFIVGPILAALFVTAWEIYGVVFHEHLEEEPAPGE
ncbi:MAG: AI-2E family transporter [Candidatus Eisenbacteria bacterium]